MIRTLGRLYIYSKFDDAFGFGINLIYFNASKKLHFMMKLFTLKIIIGYV